MKINLGAMAVLLLSLAAWPANAADSGKTDDSPHLPLTPFNWKKPAADIQDSGPANNRTGGPVQAPLQAPAPEPDDLECEKDVVHPTPAPQDMRANLVQNQMGMVMGVQHCWRKSDPGTIIERPFRLMDPMLEAMRGAFQQPGTDRSIGAHFPPLKKPRMPASRNAKPKPKAKPTGVSSSTAATISAPLPEDDSETLPVVKGTAAPLLR